MPADIFTKRKLETFVFLTIVVILTFWSVVITKYDIAKGFTSIFEAAIWGFSNFYPNAAAFIKMPDMLHKLWETILMSIAATTVAAFFAGFLSLSGSRTTSKSML
jgi:phosphonate transport system permease protein